jgi:hypothetical protein
MSSSDEDGATLMAAFKNKGNRDAAAPRLAARAPRAISVVEHTPEVDEGSTQEDGTREGSSRAQQAIPRRAVCVRITPVQRKHEYTYYEPQIEIEAVRREWSRRGEMMFDVLLVGGISKEVSGFGKGSLTGPAKVVKAMQLYPRRKP